MTHAVDFRRSMVVTACLAAVAMLAALFPPGTAAAQTSEFTDIGGNAHRDAIIALAEAEVTRGCNPEGTLYCPRRTVTRAQMATFLVTAAGLPPTNQNFFEDIGGSAHRDNINALVAAGVAQGVSATRFAPERPVTRAQMATFITNAWELEPPPQPVVFSDVSPTNAHASNIGALAFAGITYGCGEDAYCPGASVRRDQMASFLWRAMDPTAGGPPADPPSPDPGEPPTPPAPPPPPPTTANLDAGTDGASLQDHLSDTARGVVICSSRTLQVRAPTFTVNSGARWFYFTPQFYRWTGSSWQHVGYGVWQTSLWNGSQQGPWWWWNAGANAWQPGSTINYTANPGYYSLVGWGTYDNFQHYSRAQLYPQTPIGGPAPAFCQV